MHAGTYNSNLSHSKIAKYICKALVSQMSNIGKKKNKVLTLIARFTAAESENTTIHPPSILYIDIANMDLVHPAVNCVSAVVSVVFLYTVIKF